MKKKILIVVAIFLILAFGAYLLRGYWYNYQKDPDSDLEGNQYPKEIFPMEISSEGRFYGEYTVKEGDTLDSIAEEFDLQESTIFSANNMEQNDNITVGQILKIPPVDGIIITVEEEDTLESISKEYDVSKQVLADFNWLDSPYSLEIGMELFVPFISD